MRHIKTINEFSTESSNSLKWWSNLQPDDQQTMAEKYFPDNTFGALALSDEDIESIYLSEFKNIGEGKAHDVVKKQYAKKPWDPDKKHEFRTKIKNHVKSVGQKTNQVGNDLEVICGDKVVAQIMFRDDYVGVKKIDAKFADEFKYSELGDIKRSIGNIIKSCKD